MSVTATDKNYVLKAKGQKKESAGGILMYNTDDTEFGEVVDVGPNVEHPIAIGSSVVVVWNHAIPVTISGEKVFIVKQEAIIGVVNASE